MERPISTLALLRGHPLVRYSIPKDVVWSLAIGQLRPIGVNQQQGFACAHRYLQTQRHNSHNIR